MKYLTSKGVTSNTLDYVKDILDLNFHLEYNRIPYLEMGVNSLIEDLRLKESKIIINTKVTDVIQLINKRNNLNISVEDIIMNESNIHLKLSIGGYLINKVL